MAAAGEIPSSEQAVADLEKAFHCVPQDVISWAMRKQGVEEWIVWLVQGMYANA